jgi:hypothetical protein
MSDEGQRQVMTEKNPNQEKVAGEERSAKKPYSKPEFRYERAFETTALACGKMRGTQPSCRFNRKTS